ncbi:hypothetical protein, partial [Lishizhenia sp.]|uniref:hypothetical protein n=1 Tax=Lishizhenia sp. TaxID=2497594 RepID=UPI00299D4002
MKKAPLIFSTILGLFILMSFVYQQDTTKEKSNSAIIYNTENKEWISSKTTLISAFNELAEDYHHVDKVSLSKIDDAEYTLTFWLKSGALAIAYTLENNDGNLVLIPSKEVYLHSCSGAPCSSVELKGYENDDSYPS